MYEDFIVSSSTATLREIAELENGIGFSLPLSFVSFVEKYNGARFEGAEVVSGEGLFGLRKFISVDAILQATIAFGNTDLCAFAEDDCGNFFVFAKDKSSAVYFWDHETNEMEVVSEGFDLFLASIQKCSRDTKHVLKNVSAWIDPDFLASLETDS